MTLPSGAALPATAGGALVLLLGAIAVAAWSYIKGKLIAPPKVEASLVGGVIGGNELRLILEVLARGEAQGAQFIAGLADVQQSTERVERAIRDNTISVERTATTTAQTLARTGEETRRAADLIHEMMRRPAAPLPPGYDRLVDR